MRDPVQTIALLIALGLIVAGAIMSLLPSVPGREQASQGPTDPNGQTGGPAADSPEGARQHPPGSPEGSQAGGTRQYSAGKGEFLWLGAFDQADLLANRIAPPQGYERVPSEPGSFANWLRRLPLKKGRPDVLLFDGSRKANQEAHFAVVDIDTGSTDLQQCADAIIRLRAEYLFATGRQEDIHFNFTSGSRADWAKWSQGYRPVGSGAAVRWARSARGDNSYQGFRKYLETVFNYAGTLSLARELQPVTDPAKMQIGDVFIKGGSPGHAVIVVDLAANKATGKRCFLLAQSFMPAQDVHILKNPGDAGLNPWYGVEFGQTLVTPEWKFARGELKRFP